MPQKVVLFKLGHHNSGEILVTCPIRICILISREQRNIAEQCAVEINSDIQIYLAKIDGIFEIV